ncbi:acyclic sesquiterpene synthase-like isoform X1 [Hordeum vulgare subsp. vulgare]|uniref:acyclic sesquiterpene synthase-like isoform X1 n=1 Tax=Hordeum vulgare subsp. vulgare TaxID=112509 RepID=UPI001B8545A3|nr:acyclic sesquiterpene synthase-like isoform X1 [Hordeum vulgare subsp. vulgare]
MAAMMVVNTPASSSITRPNAGYSSSGGGLPCRVLQMRPSRAPRPAVARAVAKNRPEVGGNAASMPNLVEKNARETRTKKQLHKPQEAPTYQESIHRQLSMVDVLQKIGISRHFASEIKSILDFTYSYWLQRDEIILGAETCAMAFRILRMNGYNVSADGLSHISTDLSDTRSLLELYKASQVSTSDDELILDSIGSWSGHLLKQQLTSTEAQRAPLLREVEHVLDSPFYTMLDRLEHKRNIEQFDVIEHPILQLTWQTNQDLLGLGVMDFYTSQSIYQQEYQHLDSWVKESRLNQLPFARQKLAYFYLSAASTMFPPELSDARILWAMNGALTTVVDDFFDVGGSKDELENLTALVEMWENQEETEYFSEQVEIVFSAIYSSVNELGSKASAVQGRDVTGHLVEIWQELLRNMMTEVEWRTSGYVPTLDEYIENAVVTFALGPIVLPALYFVGPKITESMVIDPEYSELFRLMSTCGRLLNDVQTYEREYKEGKLNSVSLLVLHSDGSMTIPEARMKLQKPIDTCRRDLLRLVLREDNVIPRPCKELFWNICKTCYFFYYEGDAFSCQEEKAGAVDAVIHDPLQLPMNLLSELDLSTLRERIKIEY